LKEQTRDGGGYVLRYLRQVLSVRGPKMKV
jgi:hypothetical protein